MLIASQYVSTLLGDKVVTDNGNKTINAFNETDLDNFSNSTSSGLLKRPQRSPGGTRDPIWPAYPRGDPLIHSFACTLTCGFTLFAVPFSFSS